MKDSLTQYEKLTKTIEGEKLDHDAARKLNKRNSCDSNSTQETIMKMGAEKIDFSKITYKGYEKVCVIAMHPYDWKRYINTFDESLGENYLLFTFEKIDSEAYIESWARVLLDLGITPTDKGIKFLTQKIDRKMKDIMYESFFENSETFPIGTIRECFYREFYRMLKEVLDSKNICKKLEDDPVWNEINVLYVYKGRTRCHTRGHKMTSATAILMGWNNSKIDLNVEYCSQCEKFYMSFVVYETYRKKHGVLLGKLRMDCESMWGIDDIVLSEYSPLRLNGYNVGQLDGYSKKERQYILSKVIETGTLSKSEVIRYLEHFINKNGQRIGNEIALSKWKEDLEFVLQYNLIEQDKYNIKQIQKYQSYNTKK